MVDESCANGGFILLAVYRHNTGKHSGNEDNDNDQEKHKIMVKINDLLHDFCCWGLEIHLSGRSCVKSKCSETTFCCFATERLAVSHARSVDTSRVTLSYRVLNGKHI